MALNITEGGGARNLPRFLYLKAIDPFISAELRARVTNPIEYLNLASGTRALGTPAEALVYNSFLKMWWLQYKARLCYEVSRFEIPTNL